MASWMENSRAYKYRQQKRTGFTALPLRESSPKNWTICQHLRTLMSFKSSMTIFLKWNTSDFIYFVKSRCCFLSIQWKSMGSKCCFGPYWLSLCGQKHILCLRNETQS